MVNVSPESPNVLEDSKPIWKSKTVWSGVLAAAPMIGQILETVGVIPPGTVSAFMGATVAFVAAMATIYSRIVAQRKVTVLPTKEG